MNQRLSAPAAAAADRTGPHPTGLSPVGLAQCSRDTPTHPLRQLESTRHRRGGKLPHLCLSASRQVGRYLSNRMVRLAFSDCTSLRSIQLDTSGFQPRSAGLMYRMPGGKRRGRGVGGGGQLKSRVRRLRLWRSHQIPYRRKAHSHVCHRRNLKTVAP